MKFNVYGTVTAGCHLGEYEAETAEAAVEMALNEKGGYISLCHECAHKIEEPEITDAIAEPAE